MAPTIFLLTHTQCCFAPVYLLLFCIRSFHILRISLDCPKKEKWFVEGSDRGLIYGTILHFRGWTTLRKTTALLLKTKDRDKRIPASILKWLRSVLQCTDIMYHFSEWISNKFSGRAIYHKHIIPVSRVYLCQVRLIVSWYVDVWGSRDRVPRISNLVSRYDV